MNEERPTLEKIAPTIEEAIEEGLSELGLSEDQVNIEVLDEGSKGLLGIGSRQARVRITIKGTSDAQETPETPQTATTDLEFTPEIQNTISIAEATVGELLEKMNVTAKITHHLKEDSRGSQPNIIIDITGNDLSILIGRKAETLNALQYITRMIVGKEIGRSSHIILDVEGYRNRREQNLRQLAQKMANQAIKSGRRQTLEPMPPAERRIIHVELQDNDDVTTQSIGEEPRRKVTITPN